jgi:hypothetical protein
VAGAEVGGEVVLEGLDLRAEDERAAVDDLGDLGVDLGAERLERGLGVEERQRHEVPRVVSASFVTAGRS